MFTDPDRVCADIPGRVEGNPVFIYHEAFNPDQDEANDLKDRYLRGRVGDVEVKKKLARDRSELTGGPRMYLSKVRINNELYPTHRFYPFSIPVLRETAELTFRRPVAFFVGENGSGKSTLLEAITKKCGVHIWHKPKRHTAHNNPYETCLADYITVTWANGHVPGSLFRAETFHDFADFIDDVALCDPGRLKYHGGRILNTLSHGEGILSYFSGRYHIKGIYFLDEPEAALSPASQVKFLRLLRRLEKEGHAQFIIATHSPILLAYPGAQIFSLDSSPVEEVSYEDTTHYRLYKQFFSDRSVFLEA